MASLTIVSGCPGTGKTTLAGRLSEASECDADRFSMDGVRHMHAAFADLGEFEAHAVDTSARSPDETLAEFARRRAAGELRLDLPRVAGSP